MNLLIRLLLLAVLCCFPLGAMAQEVELGSGVLCDTQEQMEQYVALMDSGETIPQAIQQVNDTAPLACGIVQVFYVRGATVKTVHLKQGLRDIVAVVVVGTFVNGQPQQTMPVPQFALFPSSKEES